MLNIATPDKVYGELFYAVQEGCIFSDSKTFVDAIPKADPAYIIQSYAQLRQRPDFDLKQFVSQHFDLPKDEIEQFHNMRKQSVHKYIEQQWAALTRDAQLQHRHSSLIALPNAYVVPGGRFREIYYWDSYFTMLGLVAAGLIESVEKMVANFASLIDQLGFIPNGNRTYFCTRSQPPFFALMVELLAQAKRDKTVCQRYIPQMEKEHAFWMSGAELAGRENRACRRVVPVASGYLNRYWDAADLPRQESHYEDVQLAASTRRKASVIYRNLRAACESGWDFSSRWLEDGHSLASIRTTELVPIDLNAVMYKLESVLARAHAEAGNKQRSKHFQGCADRRAELIRSLCFDAASGFFVDLLIPDLTPSGALSLAAVYPLFFNIATPQQASSVARKINTQYLKKGGWVTSLTNSGQQWDAPNGWAPLQWIVYNGLLNYGFEYEAREGARRWVDNNLCIYREAGRLVEKYNVEDLNDFAGGGEYGLQHGFGWTNSILLKFMAELM